MQGAIRFGIGLLMFSSSCAVFAQAEAEGQEKPAAFAPAKKKAAPVYQMKEVSGRVLDAATRQPLAGIRVGALNDSRYSAMTDESGAYTIKVPVFVTALIVNDEEYSVSQVAIKGSKAADFYLYRGIISNLYGSRISPASSNTLNPVNSSATTPEEDIENHLASTVRTINRGGLPAQGAVLFMNGLNSIHSNAQPLVVIDDVIWDMQYDRSALHDGIVTNIFSLIDPEDVADIELLRNGTALYGAQGANGVIKITTKRGRSMATRINLRVFGGYQLAPTNLKVMNGSQYRNYASEFIGTIKDADKKVNLGSHPFFSEDPSYIFYDMYHNNTDWQKDLYRNTFTQNYKVSVEGGDDVAMYNLSLGYTRNDATIKENDFNRLNIRFNTDVNLFRNASAAMDFGFMRNTYNQRDNGWAEDYSQRNISSPNVLGLLQSPAVSMYNSYIYFDPTTGKLIPGIDGNKYGGQNYDDANNPFAFPAAYGQEPLANPYWILQNGAGNNKNYQEQTLFMMNLAPKYKVTPYLTISDRFSYQLTRSNEISYLPHDGVPVKNIDGFGSVQSFLQIQFTKQTMLYNDLRVDWSRKFKGHTVDLTGGFRFAAYGYSDSYASSYNNNNDKKPNISLAGDSHPENGGTNDSWRNVSYYLDANYNFRNRYFLRGSLSAAASSRFGTDTEEGIKVGGVSWGIFPSLQAAWVISNESWFKSRNIDFLKLSAAYESSGNDDVDYYGSRTYFQLVRFMKRFNALELANVSNSSLQWETTHRFNLGLQSSMLKNRLQLGIDWYYAKTTNLLNRKQVSDITGLPFIWANDGSLENSGVEFNANAVLLNRKNWKWQAGFSIGHYRNEITDLDASNLNTIKTYALDANGQRDESTLRTLTGYLTSVYGTKNVMTAVGHAAGVFYGYKTAGVFASDEEARTAGRYGYLRYPTGITSDPYRNFKAGDVHFVDQNGDGWINEADMVVIGNPNPDIFGNFYTSLTWKDLTLDVNFKYSLGNDIFNFQRQQLESANNLWNQTTAVVNRWRYDGQQTDMPRTMSPDNEEWVNNERFSDRWIEDGSYLKLKKVRLTYRIPVNCSWLQGLAVWGEANNVFTVTKYLGQDPEVSCNNGVLYQGIDAGMLPSTRSFSFGVNINL